jgi:hypothetical protein
MVKLYFPMRENRPDGRLEMKIVWLPASVRFRHDGDSDDYVVDFCRDVPQPRRSVLEDVAIRSMMFQYPTDPFLVAEIDRYGTEIADHETFDEVLA